jgi:hypothetical protein
MIAAAQAEYAEALEMAEDNDEISAATGIQNLQKTAGKLARETEMEMLLTKHSDHAPRTAELVRGTNCPTKMAAVKMASERRKRNG